LVEIDSVVSEEKMFLITDFDRLCKLEKRGDEIKKKSSPLKLLSQSQSNFTEMILGWPPSKIVSCLYSSNLGTFWLKIEQFWPFEEISIFSNSGHFEWRAGLSDTILKGDHPRTIPAKFALIWFSNLAGMVPGSVPFKIVSDSPALLSRWLLLIKMLISSIEIS
jgi:hypothetical protein